MKYRLSMVVTGLVALGATIAFTREAGSTPASTLAEPLLQEHGQEHGQEHEQEHEQEHGQEHGQPQLPPGWTEADMQACMEAGMPGAMHAHLTEAVGQWKGKHTLWMAPGAEPQVSECTSNVTALMDGRYIQTEIEGEMPGMGPFSGFGLYGFDNVAQQFQSTWIDNCGTGMMVGTGQLSPDGKTLTWSYTYNCPITQKQAKLREIERVTGKDSRTLEMFGTDPKSGKEYKMMQIEFTRTAAAAVPASSTR